MVDRNLAEALERALQGDAKAIAYVSPADHPSLQEAERPIGAPLVVKKAAAVRILRGLIEGRFSPSAAQAWASFMRRGFVEGAADGPIQPIDIQFEDACAFRQVIWPHLPSRMLAPAEAACGRRCVDT